MLQPLGKLEKEWPELVGKLRMREGACRLRLQKLDAQSLVREDSREGSRDERFVEKNQILLL